MHRESAIAHLKYIAAPTDLCSDNLLVLCGGHQLLLSEVLSTPAHNPMTIKDSTATKSVEHKLLGTLRPGEIQSHEGSY